MPDRLIKVPCAMTIAGSDSGGGAGVEADLKTFAALGVFGTCAITAVTAQNTRGVYDVFPIPPEVVRRQIEIVLEDIEVGAAKTGMLYSKEIMEVVSEAIDRYELKMVVDPVMKAGTGADLIPESEVESLSNLIVSRAFVATPNRYEAEQLSGIAIRSLEDMKEAAVKISRLGSETVVIKGGHLDGATVRDVLYHNGTFKVFEKPRVKVRPHGGGCSFSAAIAGYLACGESVLNAVSKAEDLIQDAIRFGVKVGGGRVPVNPLVHLYNEAEKVKVLQDVQEAAEMIVGCKELLPYIAEVGTQVAMALRYAYSREHVAAVEGRIVKTRGGAKAVGPAKFAASSHMARLVLKVMEYNPEVRAALNLHYDPHLVEAFREVGFTVSSFERSLEPSEVKAVEGRSLVWGVETAVKSVGMVPDVIYDLGEVGKEPMIRVLGNSATNAVKKVLKVMEQLTKKRRVDKQKP